MVALGLVLLLVGLGGGALLTWMALQTPDTVALGAPGLQLTVAPVTVFAAGAVAMLLLWLGFRLMAAGTRRRVAQRRELRELKNAPPAPRTAPTGGPVTSPPPGAPTPDRAREVAPPPGRDPRDR
ncbi:MAG TPA: hypothetical protein PLL54_06555 [Dermatophilaceae bacterium]|nr:hypothetical protein [Dermatophilaceae bacterium]